MAIEDHSYHEATCTTDVAMELWAQKCEESVSYNQSNSSTQQSSNRNIPNTDNSNTSELRLGWALKSDRKFVRFSTAIKQYVKNVFEEGEKSGKKSNPMSYTNS